MLPLISLQPELIASIVVASAVAMETPVSASPTVTTAPQIYTSATDLGSPISLGESLKSSQSPSFAQKTGKITRLIASERGKKSIKFDFAQNPQPTPTQQQNSEIVKLIELTADKQQYIESEQVIIASGNVLLKFANAILKADQVRVNLSDRLVVAEGNVTLKRGEQILNGERFEYYFVADRGVIYNASGEIYRATFEQDLSPNITNSYTNQVEQDFGINQPLQNVVSAGGTRFVVGSVRDLKLTGQNVEAGGTVDRFRFQAEKINFEGNIWTATNISLTNDPFSPPEVEIKADTAEFKNITQLQDRLTTKESRVVFDNGFALPLFADEFNFSKDKRQPFTAYFGFDGDDKGGFFIQRRFIVIDNDNLRWSITPQYLIQKAFSPDSFNVSEPNDDRNIFRPAAFGLATRLNTKFSERTDLFARADLSSLNLNEFDDQLRATVRLNQKIGNIQSPYKLSLEYNYRDRLFNGSLGFQTVQRSFGVVITSPRIDIGKTGASFIYQGSVQNITATTDVESLLGSNSSDDLTNLTRYQAAAIINKNFTLWQGKALPATREEGLRFSPVPIVPYFQINTGATVVASLYSNGDTQPSLRAYVGFEGRLGHLRKNFFDYTGFNFSFSQGARGNASPFKFDRFVDSQTISFGITQQIYGPLLFGVQSSFNVNTAEEISTDYILEYSRRTYNIVLLYNPTLAIGSINLRINDFNWDGKSEKFEKETKIEN